MVEEIGRNKLPNWIRKEYPFPQNFYQFKSGENIHYLDEGDKDAEVLVMLHGNPTWSFYYRNFVKEFSKTHRVIVPDHIGCGLSDKPQDYQYTLKNHIENLEALLNSLGIKKANFMVHDWGGAIGFGLFQRNPSIASKIVVLNTAAYTSNFIAAPINFCRIPVLGEKLIRSFNAFAWPATFMAVEKPLKKVVKKGLLYPYNNYRNRIATSRFVEDIPMSKKHRSFRTLKSIEDSLENLKCPKLFLWGKKDFCFNDYFLNRWKGIYPEAKFIEYSDSGHYVIEDKKDECIKEMRNFL